MTTDTKTDKPSPQSVLGKIAARREELNKERFIDLEIPGYEGDLWARVRPVEFSAMKNAEVIAGGLEEEEAELLKMQFIVASAIDEFFVEVDDERVPPVEGNKTGLRDLGLLVGIEPSEPVFDPDGNKDGDKVKTDNEILAELIPDSVSLAALYFTILAWQEDGNEAVAGKS